MGDGSFLYNLILFLHVAAAIFLLGPAVLVVSASAPVIRRGPEGIAVLRWLQRSTTIYGFGSLVVGVIGAGLVQSKYGNNWGDVWITASVVLFVVAALLVLLVVLPGQRRAIRALEVDSSAKEDAARIAIAGGVASLAWLAVLVLMIWQPGG